MSEFIQRIQKLPPHKRDILFKRLYPTKDNASIISAQPLKRVETSSRLSFGQQRLWVLEQIIEHRPVYNIPICLRMLGPLEVTILEQSLNTIIRRHDVLRATFSIIDDQPVQMTAPAFQLSIEHIDLQHILPATQEDCMHQHLTHEARRPFSLSQGPLLRVVLIQLRAQEHVLLLVMHHIVADGWSLGVIFQELSVLYQAYLNGAASPLDELPIQYTDFALWQREHLQGERLERHLSYWKQELAQAPHLLALPTDHPRPAVQSFQGARLPLALPAPLTHALKRLALQEDTTLFMLLLAAFQTLLYRYSGQQDFLIGAPIANRTLTQTEGLIGFFVNTLPLRARLDDALSFRSLLHQTRERTLEAYTHQDLPFERLVEELCPQRDLSYNPLIQVMFVLQTAPMQLPTLPDLQVHQVDVENGTTPFDLLMDLTETDDGLSGYLTFAIDLFELSTPKRLVGHFQALLEGIVAQPDQKLRYLPLLTVEEERQLLFEWNNTQVPYPTDRCIHQLFEEQVERSPEALALVYHEEQLTYAALNQRANQLAHALQAKGVGPEVLVAICVERSVEMVVGILGILKAGGVYVPLDPTYPQKRLAYLLQDSQVALMLTQRQLAERLPACDLPRLYLDEMEMCLAGRPLTNPVSAVGVKNLAYVIYTSGSTGQPKGVAIAHQSTVALLSWAKKIFSQRALSGVLASTSLCFDLSVFEIFVPLSWGGTVILVENLLHLSTLPEHQAVTLINTVPSMLVELLKMEAIPASVQVINLAGEALSNALSQQIYQQSAVESLINLYGPTEDTTYSTFHVVQKESTKTPAIGRPINNTQVYVLDAHMQPVPIGIPGELYLGGSGLARGYLNRPDLTSQRFIPNPFHTQLEGARLYKTGDLVRYLADGSLEFIERIDRQVKLRGIRIELEEIEAVLNQHQAVQESVVLIQGNSSGNKILVGYVIPCAGHTLSTKQLQQFAQDKLPRFMVPATFIQLDSLPLTPNGKLNRNALPLLEQTTNASGVELSASLRTPTEAALAEIWQQTLGLQNISVHDNFFELGGHSLKAIELLSRIKRGMNVKVSLATLFEAPTISSFALRMVKAPSNLPPSIIPIQRGNPNRPPIFILSGIRGHVGYLWNLGAAFGPEQTVYAVQGAGLNGEIDLFDGIEKLASYYIASIRQIQQQGPYIFLGSSSGGVIGFEIAHQLEALDETVTLGMLDTAPPSYFQEMPVDFVEVAKELLGKTGRALLSEREQTDKNFDDIVHMCREEATSFFYQAGQESGVIPDSWSLEDFQYTTDFIIAQTRALTRYCSHLATIMAPIHMFVALDKKGNKLDRDEWSIYTKGGLRKSDVPGDHDSMIQPPHVAHTVKAIVTSFNQDGLLL